MDQEGISPNDAQPAITSAEAPFSIDGPGDAVLQSSDHVQFKVHKLLLMLGSSVFKDMFSMPQPSAAPQNTPVITVAENASTLRDMLSILSPEAVPPEWKNVDDAFKVALACQKYMIPLSRWHFSAQSLWTSKRLLKDCGLELYSLAWRLGPDELVKKMSRYTHAANLFHQDNIQQVIRLSGDFNAVVALCSLRDDRADQLDSIFTKLRLGPHICSAHTNIDDLKTMASFDNDDEDDYFWEMRRIRQNLIEALGNPDPICTDAFTFMKLESGTAPTGSGSDDGTCQCFEDYDSVAATAILARMVALYPKEVRVKKWRPGGPLMQ